MHVDRSHFRGLSPAKILFELGFCKSCGQVGSSCMPEIMWIHCLLYACTLCYFPENCQRPAVCNKPAIVSCEDERIRLAIERVHVYPVIKVRHRSNNHDIAEACLAVEKQMSGSLVKAFPVVLYPARQQLAYAAACFCEDCNHCPVSWFCSGSYQC